MPVRVNQILPGLSVLERLDMKQAGGLLVLVGVDEPVAVSAVLICRIATLWFAVAIGLVAALELELGNGGRYAMIDDKQGGGV